MKAYSLEDIKPAYRYYTQVEELKKFLIQNQGLAFDVDEIMQEYCISRAGATSGRIVEGIRKQGLAFHISTKNQLNKMFVYVTKKESE